MAVAHSQLDPLPQNLPFEIISKTIGRGAYASVKKGRVGATGDVFAVKFIHRRFALERGCISLRQIQSEVALHKHCGMHKNLIQYYDSGEDDVWTWIAMEYASGGDLFDKIEADVGVEEDISHFYFTQLVAGVSYIHGQGVAHRDIKPENILLDGGGNLKIADFGLAALFRYQDRYKYSKTLCGSPPYVAPEVLQGQYRGDLVDIWSCGVLLFTLLSGNTPWDEPTDMSMEFLEYRAQKGRPTHEPWLSLPSGSLSLIRGMMKIDPEDRFKFEDIRRHPWFTRPNPYLTHDGLCHNGVNLATKLMKGLHIDFTKILFPKKPGETFSKLSSSTQPEAPVDRQVEFEWERLYQPTSQPLEPPENFNSQDLWASLAEDPSMSQFAPPHRAIPQSLTQKARNFNDICPSQRMTRFYSPYSFRQLLPIIASALHRLGVSIPRFKETQYEEDNVETWIPVKAEDSRRCLLRGDIIVERLEGDVLVVTFAKTQGDPLEWRRFFKKVAVLSKEAVWMGPDCD